jgi:hypothetical protein
MRIVLDTDVLLSGLRSTMRASRILLLAIEAGVDEREADLGIVICRPGDILRRFTWRPSATLPFAFPRR